MRFGKRLIPNNPYMMIIPGYIDTVVVEKCPNMRAFGSHMVNVFHYDSQRDLQAGITLV